MSHTHEFDPEAFKRTTRDQWNKSAQGWNDQTPHIHAWLSHATEAMLDLADVRPGAHGLDVAAGAGDQTIDIAKRVGPNGHVLSTDLSPDLMHHALQCREPDWSTIFDWDPAQAAQSRRRFLAETAGTGRFVLPIHFPHPTTGLIEADGERFRYNFVR